MDQHGATAIAISRARVLIAYEPSWFAEFSSGLGMLLWGFCALVGSRYRVEGAEVALPLMGILLGPIRWVFLLRANSPPRAGMAFVAASWWITISCSLYAHSGVVTALGAYAALTMQDALTLAKFSAPHTRPMLHDLRVLWRRRT